MSREAMRRFLASALASVVICAAPVMGASGAGIDAYANIHPASPDAANTVGEELDCLIEPYETVEVATTVSGIVHAVYVDRGSLVREGQVLAELDTEVEKANVANAEAKAVFAWKKYVRMEELHKEEMVSTQKLEEAKADSDVAQAELQKAKELLNQRIIRSPFSGVVMERYASPGELVESKKILKVAQINPLSVEVIAPIAMLGAFRPGETMQVVPEGPQSGPYEARVRLVDRVVDAASGTFRVRLKLPNPRYRIAAGVRCRARLVEQGAGPVSKAKH